MSNSNRDATAQADEAGHERPRQGLSPADRRRVLVEWNATSRDYPTEVTLHELFEAQVKRTPGAVALVFETAILSYDELNRRANRLARYLRSLGVGPEVLVGLCAERSVEMVVGLLGILKAGGAYVPLDPNYPRERLRHMVEDARMGVLLAQRHLVERLPPIEGTVLCLDDQWSQIVEHGDDNAAPSASAENLAYVIFTSGSTGRPKGAMNEHRAITNRLFWMQEQYGLTPSDRVLQKTPFSFDVSVWEFFWPLLFGARLVVARPRGHQDAAYLVDTIVAHEITTVHFVPSMLQVFLDERDVERCGCLKRVICSGEALPFELQERFFARLGVELHNLYGPTEAAVDVTYWACRRDPSQLRVPIGRPVANTQIYILDEQMQPVPIGAAGELHIGGVQVGRGYVNRPELTVERFVPDPYGGQPGARLYKTGDLARFLHDGNIEYLGRLDHQVKIRGQRIELGEIEAVLGRGPCVREVVVLAREHEPGHRRLVAYLVPDARSLESREQENTSEIAAGHVSQWQKVHEETYFQTAPHHDPSFNTAGWNSSYTRQSIGAVEMREWLDQTLRRIKSLRPQRVLELGCGTGMLLYALAPHCRVYQATDFSHEVVAALEREVRSRGHDWSHVTVAQRDAADMTGVPAGEFDLVILNSVLQFFPGIDYLVGVLRRAAEIVAPGGKIFVGDVRSLPLLEAFHTSVQRHQASCSLPTAVLRQRIDQRIRAEPQLVVDPEFFYALARELPRPVLVRVQLRRGRFRNEMNLFRYDAILDFGAENARNVCNRDAPQIDWQDAATSLASLRRELSHRRPETLRLTRVPNARLVTELKAVELLRSPAPPATVGELADALAEVSEQAVEPDDVWALAEELGYQAEIAWSANGAVGCFDVTFSDSRAVEARKPAPRPPHPALSPEGGEGFSRLQAALEGPSTRNWQSYANDPLRAKVAAGLVPALREFAKRELPDYMVPSAFVVLDALPLSPNGKVDRRALPAPDQRRPDLEQAYVAPRTKLEAFLEAAWRDVLAVDSVGIHDDFFDLGGDSIRGALFINRLQQALGGFFYVVTLFDAPTIARFAAYLEAHHGDAVRRRFGEGATGVSATPAASRRASKLVDDEMLARFRALIAPRAPCAAAAEKNAPAVFILAPPRSGSTLLRVMLAGHSSLFAPPELELLEFETLAERSAAYAGRFAFRLEGTIRAIMDVRKCGAEEAKRVMEEFESAGRTTQAFYRALQQWIVPRQLVDKTVAYALDLATLRRAEQVFDSAKYIHLSRHPRAMIHSFESVKLDELFFRHAHDFTPRELAELIWVTSEQNVLEFFREVPPKRQHHVRFEDLLADPRHVMGRLCEFLQIDFQDGMLEPYRNQERKMTDGVFRESRMFGDPKFHQYRSIDASVADRWRGEVAPEALGQTTRRVTLSLGYDEPVVTGSETIERLERRPRVALPLSFAQQRLWFLDKLTSRLPTYNIPKAFRIRGALDAAALRRSMEAIVDRHEVLRATFPNRDGRPITVIAPPGPIELSVIDLQGLPAAERERRALELATEESRRTFDLAQDRLIRFTLYCLDSDDHVLLVVMHHIVSDGWSIGIFRQELGAIYEALVAGRPAPLGELPVQYADFAAAQRRWMESSDVLGTHLAYWKRRLAGAPAVLELPTDRPRPPEQTYTGARQFFRLSKSLSEALGQLAREQGVTLFMTLMAAFKALLHRYSGADSIVVGSPVAGRNRREAESLIGFFINNLVLRTELGDDPTFAELLGRVREGLMGALAHQDVPFEKLVEELDPRRDLSHHPLFQVVFILQNAPMPPLVLPNLTLETVEIDNGTAKFDLTMFLMDEADGLSGWVEYNTDLFDADTIRRLRAHYETLLESIVADPLERVSALPILTEVERRQLLFEWNDPRAEFPNASCLHELFEAQAARSPDSIALTFEGRTCSYGELNSRANRLANRLRRMGIGPDVLVPICVERSIEMVVGILGILKAGGAYVPLDPAYPKERLSFMLEDTAARVLVTESALSELVARDGVETIRLDADDRDAVGESTSNLACDVEPDNLAYVIYTSGSTGTPKGVQVTHRNVVRLLDATESWFHFGAADVWTLFHSYAFDFSVWELWGALAYGGRLVVVPYLVSRSPEAFYDLVRSEGVTVLNQTPSAFNQFIQVDEVAKPSSRPRLRYVIFGGEALDLASLRPWFNRHGDQHPQLINMYGITETTVHVTYRPIREADLSAARASPIGRPIPDLQVYLLDRHGHLVPVGVPGEICVGGAGVARGYLSRPELTAERFVRHPFATSTGSRLYRSGDLGRYLPDGDIDYLGRIDHQVKIRGFRIELGEIEAILGQHPSVRETVVVALEEAHGAKRLVAYVVPRDGAPVSTSDLRELARTKLPDYMVPSAFVSLDRLPLTSNGKVDRRALPRPDQARPELARDYVEPQNDTERALARIWGEVLRIDRVGVHDNFFELGGDSILTIQVIARARHAGLQLAPKQFFQYQTIAELASVVGHVATVQAEQEALVGPVTLTPIQRWFFEHDLSEPHHFNQAVILEMRERVEVDSLDRVVRAIVVHHDALRLRFARSAAGWRQSYAAPADGMACVERIDLSTVSPNEIAKTILSHCERLQASLNLATGPICRFALFDAGTSRPNRLLIIVHHLAVDGVSWRILLEDLATAIDQDRRGEPIVLPAKTTAFRHWAQRLAEYAHSVSLLDEVDRWLPSNSTAAPTCGGTHDLPLDHAGGGNLVASAETVSESLDAEETRALLHDVPDVYHTQINDVLLAALVLAFGEWTGERSVWVDLEGHGRESLFDDVDLSRTVGWFTSIFPVRLETTSCKHGEALKAIKEQLRQIPNHGIGYGLLRYLSGDADVAERLAAVPRPQISFNYLGQFNASSEGAALRLTDQPCGTPRSAHAKRTHRLNINAVVADGRLRVDWSYSREQFERATMARLARYYLDAVRSIIRHCQSPEAGGYTPSDFSKVQLSQGELDELLSELGDETADRP